MKTNEESNRNETARLDASSKTRGDCIGAGAVKKGDITGTSTRDVAKSPDNTRPASIFNNTTSLLNSCRGTPQSLHNTEVNKFGLSSTNTVSNDSIFTKCPHKSHLQSVREFASASFSALGAEAVNTNDNYHRKSNKNCRNNNTNDRSNNNDSNNNNSNNNNSNNNNSNNNNSDNNNSNNNNEDINNNQALTVQNKQKTKKDKIFGNSTNKNNKILKINSTHIEKLKGAKNDLEGFLEEVAKTAVDRHGERGGESNKNSANHSGTSEQSNQYALETKFYCTTKHSRRSDNKNEFSEGDELNMKGVDFGVEREVGSGCLGGLAGSGDVLNNSFEFTEALANGACQEDVAFTPLNSSRSSPSGVNETIGNLQNHFLCTKKGIYTDSINLHKLCNNDEREQCTKPDLCGGSLNYGKNVKNVVSNDNGLTESAITNNIPTSTSTSITTSSSTFTTTSFSTSITTSSSTSTTTSTTTLTTTPTTTLAFTHNTPCTLSIATIDTSSSKLQEVLTEVTRTLTYEMPNQMVLSTNPSRSILQMPVVNYNGAPHFTAASLTNTGIISHRRDKSRRAISTNDALSLVSTSDGSTSTITRSNVSHFPKQNTACSSNNSAFAEKYSNKGPILNPTRNIFSNLTYSNFQPPSNKTHINSTIINQNLFTTTPASLGSDIRTQNSIAHGDNLINLSQDHCRMTPFSHAIPDNIYNNNHISTLPVCTTAFDTPFNGRNNAFSVTPPLDSSFATTSYSTSQNRNLNDSFKDYDENDHYIEKNIFNKEVFKDKLDKKTFNYTELTKAETLSDRKRCMKNLYDNVNDSCISKNVLISDNGNFKNDIIKTENNSRGGVYKGDSKVVEENFIRNSRKRGLSFGPAFEGTSNSNSNSNVRNITINSINKNMDTSENVLSDKFPQTSRKELIQNEKFQNRNQDINENDKNGNASNSKINNSRTSFPNKPDKNETHKEGGKPLFKRRVSKVSNGSRKSSSSSLNSPSNENSLGNEGIDYLFPAFVPITFRFFNQASLPRYWCLQLITWPYPFMLLGARE